MTMLINDRFVAVRGANVQQLGMFSYVPVEERVLVDTILKELDELLASRWAPGGHISIPPELLLRRRRRGPAQPTARVPHDWRAGAGGTPYPR